MVFTSISKQAQTANNAQTSTRRHCLLSSVGQNGGEDLSLSCNEKTVFIIRSFIYFGAEAERSYIFLQFEAENVFKILLNSQGVLMVWMLFWNSFK